MEPKKTKGGILVFTDGYPHDKPSPSELRLEGRITLPPVINHCGCGRLFKSHMVEVVCGQCKERAAAQTEAAEGVSDGNLPRGVVRTRGRIEPKSGVGVRTKVLGEIPQGKA